MNIKLTLGERLKDLRVERSLKLETLAEQTGLSKSALSKYESDDVTDLSIDLSLCRHLCGADPEYRHRRRPHRGDLGLRGIYGAAVFYLIQNRQSCKIHLRLPLRDFGPC